LATPEANKQAVAWFTAKMKEVNAIMERDKGQKTRGTDGHHGYRASDNVRHPARPKSAFSD
ncbi:MAG: hypothetical protein SPL49_10175, partial [Oribacterium sp.]|nr:hypothetical protein [Oribacterium sp.]